MRTLRRLTLSLLLVGLSAAAIPTLQPSAQDRPPSPEQDLIRRMAGTWDVRASVWLGQGAEPIVQSAVARRRLLANALLEEVMTSGSDGPAFTRVAWLGYNVVNSSYEYISWDTRAPQMMYQVSRTIGQPGEHQDTSRIWFYLMDNFVVPQWGDARNIAFKQRLMLEPGEARQIVRLYWTRLGAEPNREFLAGEYVYTRRR